MIDGSSLGDRSKFGTVIGACGLIAGIPQRTDGSDSVLAESGPQWERPVHSCASASRTIIKTVTFSYNSTGLSGLQVTGLAEKAYSSDSDYPIWAVEDVDRKELSFYPLWGLSESEDAPSGDMALKRHPHLWLHGGAALLSFQAGGHDSENLPAAWFHSMALVPRGATPRRVRASLTRLSAGCLMTATLLPEDGSKGDQPTTKAWLNRKGRVPVDISGGAPRVDKGADPGKGYDPGSSILEEERNGGQ